MTLHLGVSTVSVAQQPRDTKLLGYVKTWVEPTDPAHILGPIYYVGTRGLAAYLIATPNGHVLLDGAMPQSGHDVEASIRKLGFKPEDIRLLLITHAHIDHAGTTAYFKKLSGAPVAVMARDFAALESGGKTDFAYASLPAFHFPAVTAERTLRDGDSVSVGNISLLARLGAGHTKGATTWITTVKDGGRAYRVVFPCSASVNPNYRLVVNPSYPGIADDYRRTFRMLESLAPDVFLASHPETFDFEGRRARAATEGVSAWVDPDGYRHWLADQKTLFDQAVAKEAVGARK
jgi:metallo-beta-lactamase class B